MTTRNLTLLEGGGGGVVYSHVVFLKVFEIGTQNLTTRNLTLLEGGKGGRGVYSHVVFLKVFALFKYKKVHYIEVLINYL